MVIVTWRGAGWIGDCLASLRQQTAAHRVIVVDNGSTDGTAELLRGLDPVPQVLRLAENAGFAGGVAAALPHVDTPLVALLNDDAVADPGWLEASLAALDRHPDAAAVTSRILLWEPSANGTPVLNNAGVVLRSDWYGADRGLGQPDGPPFATPTEVFAFSGGAAVLRTAAVREAGGMPPGYFLYYEDVDLAWRLRLAGWTVWYEPAAVVWHRHGASSAIGSRSFTFHNERNRLLTLLRCAPAGAAWGQVARFVVVTASLAAQRLVGRDVPAGPSLEPGLRLKVLGALGRLLPATVAQRRAIGRVAQVPRSAVTRRWLGETH